MKIFACREIGEVEYLRADLSIVCWSTPHVVMIVFAGCPLMLLSLVVPGVVFRALHRNKKVIYAARDPQTGAVVDPEQRKALQTFVYSKTLLTLAHGAHLALGECKLPHAQLSRGTSQRRTGGRSP